MKRKVERPGGLWWEISLGFGRVQRARSFSYSAMPEAMKRAQVADPELGPAELLAKSTVEERIEYRRATARQYAIIALDAAHDWVRHQITAEEYVDRLLPEDVGDEIAEAVVTFLAGAALPPDEKKT